MARYTNLSEKDREQFFKEIEKDVEQIMGVNGARTPYSEDEAQAYYDGVCKALSILGLRDEWERFIWGM